MNSFYIFNPKQALIKKLPNHKSMDSQLLKSIFSTFNQFMPISADELDIITKHAKLLKIPKKNKLLELGQTCDKMYFILSGCLRLYYVKGETERNCFFFHENLFCTAFGSFMMQRPSNQILETIEDTVCLMITHAEFEEIYVKLPKMNVVVRKILEERYANAHDIISSFILHNPEQRYLEFIDKYPLLVNRIAEYHISSYLGITPKSFSRLKGRLRNRSRKTAKP